MPVQSVSHFYVCNYPHLLRVSEIIVYRLCMVPVPVPVPALACNCLVCADTGQSLLVCN